MTQKMPEEGRMPWTENEDGPDCCCGNPTIVKILPDGDPVLMCFFHTAETGMITKLPLAKPADWNVSE